VGGMGKLVCPWSSQAAGTMPRRMGRRRRRRLPRILLNAATAVSLVLCAATVALWVRSYRVWDTVTWCFDTANSRRSYKLMLGRGGVAAHRRDCLDDGAGWSPPWPASDDFRWKFDDLLGPGLSRDSGAAPQYPVLKPDRAFFPTMWTRWGVQWASGGNPGGASHVRSLTLPLPLVAVVFGLLPAWRCRGARHRRGRSMAGLCLGSLRPCSGNRTGRRCMSGCGPTCPFTTERC